MESDRDVYLTHPLKNLSVIMTDALQDYKSTASIRGKTITNLRFADNIEGLAREEEEVAKLAERLDKATTAYGMKISAERTKLTTNKTRGINKEIKIIRTEA